jgi:hypothetical protein
MVSGRGRYVRRTGNDIVATNAGNPARRDWIHRDERGGNSTTVVRGQLKGSYQRQPRRRRRTSGRKGSAATSHYVDLGDLLEQSFEAANYSADQSSAIAALYEIDRPPTCMKFRRASTRPAPFGMDADDRFEPGRDPEQKEARRRN